MNIVTDEKCSICKGESETPFQLFWEYDKIKSFTADITEHVKSFSVNFEIDCKTVILGNPNKIFESCDIICLEIKKYI
jgi:hypothetical protein